MALLEIRRLSPFTRLGLWRMEHDGTQSESPRQMERRNVQLLLNAMMGDGAGFAIGHEASGKPFVAARTPGGDVRLPQWRISISHTRGFAAVLLSTSEQVGLDIEYRSDRVERIASRFIRPDEMADSTDKKLLLWSAKEAVYKLFSEDNLLFFDMRATAIGNGQLRLENLKRNIVIDVCYEFTDDYVLTYVLMPGEA